MSDSTSSTCIRCGAVIPARAGDQLCPACLMSGALKTADESTLLASGSQPRSVPRPAEFPREFGEYRLRGMLGSGGMGTVYEAEQIATGRRVALKMLGRQLDSPKMRQRFLREGRLAAGVNHPNSLYVFGSEEIEGLPVITMEIAGSGTLRDRLKKRGPLPVAEAVDAILDVIAGLEAAFTAGVLHRDIKPSNCFVGADGSVKVGDFGLSVSTLAKVDTFVTAHGEIMGTPAYASPEQLRGDVLDVRADIYSVGATLYTLLTNRAPFEGDNAVQVVANAVNTKAKLVTELREDVPPGLARVVANCLAKEPAGRYANYTALRDALLPFGSSEPAPASMKVRSLAGWIDYLIAFLIPYVTIMLSIGGERLLIRPLTERTLYAWRYHVLLLSVGFLYFSIAEGVWGGGPGKRLKRLRVVGRNGRVPGIGRAWVRILIPILCVEGVRIPAMMALIPKDVWTGFHTAMFVIVTNVCAWIPILMILRARSENGFTTVWDRISGTRVVLQPKSVVRPSIHPDPQPDGYAEEADRIGPYSVVREVIPGAWLVAYDPVLRRHVWLLRRTLAELPLARRDVARPGRLRWLQHVDVGDTTWDAFGAIPGRSFLDLVEPGKTIPWSSLRHWLHDLASELWDATEDGTVPEVASLDHVWISSEGRAVLLDEPWPGRTQPAECIPVGDINGKQRFLNAVAACVNTADLPLHARPVLRNLKAGQFEKLSFLTGTLRGLLDRPAAVGAAIRAGSLFMLPLYVWVMIFVGLYHDKPWRESLAGVILSACGVLGVIAWVQLLEIPFASTASHAIFRLALVNGRGEPPSRSHLLVRWSVIWVPLLAPVSLAAWWFHRSQGGVALVSALVVLLLWISAAVYAAVHPSCGLHDRLVRTRVVRR